jgi:diguanylate cyclase (GGDEF)-like protein/putative nucleotidyltransferase with HDIG domain
MGDIDGFKLFNDTYGHVMGDEVLRLTADVCRKAVEPDGTVCRYGGDEFLIILPAQKKRAAKKLAHQIMERLGKAEFQTESNTIVPIRMSLGVASFPQDTTSPSKLVAIADAAMYEAKRRLKGAKGSVVSTRADTTFGVLESLVVAVDTKDRYTRDHCDLVAEYAVKLADRLNLSEDAKRPLRIAGLLHDIGKLVVPDEILKKPGPLTDEEYEIMQRHVKIGEVLIREVPQLKDVIQAVSCHHERYDGSGYPRGLKGEGIPLLGRIIAIADAYSAMCLDRPYRKALPHDRILSELVAGAGIQFDSEITQAFVELLLEEQLQVRRAAA